jgi:hypothetical protein
MVGVVSGDVAGFWGGVLTLWVSAAWAHELEDPLSPPSLCLPIPPLVVVLMSTFAVAPVLLVDVDLADTP